MPELPEVETYRRRAEEGLVGHRVAHVACDDELLLRNTSPGGLGRVLADATIEDATRTGKWVTLRTDANQDVVVHFGMTGSFHRHDDGDRCEFDHVRLVLDDGAVFSLHMPRKLGGVWVVRDADERDEVRGSLGVDALEADADDLRAALAGSRGGLKSMLMDQEKVAGVGNLLSDELCWQVRHHPATPCDELDDAVFDELADELARALDVGLDLGHVPTTDGFLLDVRGDGGPCPRDGSDLEEDRIGGRTSRWCPQCQAPGG